MIRPRYLRKGDTIGITAPAGSLKKEEIEEGVEIIRSWGVTVKYGTYLFRKRHSFAGTDNQRASDMQKMLNDPEISAILCARGGYGTIRIISDLNFDEFLKHPKWIAGYSDITVLHSALSGLGVESIHGAMPRTVPPAEPDVVSYDSLRAMLFGEVKEYTIQPNVLNRHGTSKGELTGGNLSVLYSMAGTTLDLDTSGKILFVEDVGEYLYHIDRMMMNMKLRGKLSGLAGLIVGDMTETKTSSSGFTRPAYKIISEAVKDYKYPIMYGFPAGHGGVNMALPMGREVRIDVSEVNCKILFSDK